MTEALQRLQDRPHGLLGEHPWQVVVETGLDIVYVATPTGEYLEVNPRMCVVFQLPREKMIGSTVFDRLEGEQVAITRRVLDEIRRQRIPERSTRTYTIGKNRQYTFELLESPLIHNGEVWAIAGIGRDVSQEIVLEQKLWDASESRRTSVDFALRTSLGLIKGYVYTLRRYGDLSEAQHARYTQIIEEEVDHLARIVENILDVRRLENSALETELDVVNVAEAVANAVAHCSDEATRRNVELEFSVPKSVQPMYLPKEALCRVLMNLIQNGMHHTLHDGKIGLTVEDHETYVDIFVRDNGVGIPEGEISNIFDKYYRGAGSAASGAQGAGMGLTIVRLLVEAMGGRISVQSRVGKGSEFRVTLPRRPVETFSIGAAPSPTQSNLSRETTHV
ncbi:PAS domain-containing protein [bacterium]|nr:PAS domain-containing protein [bacterium]MBU1983844.1 PAS domain-containing protein [bacterium]